MGTICQIHTTNRSVMAWDPDLYLKFRDYRLAPARDLIARIPLSAPERITDLGCGTGTATRLLAAKFPGADITAVDNSPEMLTRARLPGVRWHQADIADWQAAEAQNVIFSNSALHWLDDHETLFSGLIGDLAADGVLAIQMPRNFDAPSHQAIRDTVHTGPWTTRLEPLLKPAPVARPGEYHDLLAPLARSVEVWETEYQHTLEGVNPVAAWTAGTALRPFTDALDDDERISFVAAYEKRVEAAYPRRPDGKTLFPFRRLFIIATR